VFHGQKTLAPIPLAESASWDLAAIEKSARMAAVEASAIGINWTFAPMVDIGRDARWGRVMEGAGEDPYLGAKIATARVNGFETIVSWLIWLGGWTTELHPSTLEGSVCH
jgi:beta-glucosidase